MKKLALAALVSLGLMAAPAFAKSGVKIGVLNCDVSAGVGLILASSKTVKCTFDRAVGGKEYYKGTIEKLGIDIGVTGKLTPTMRPTRRAQSPAALTTCSATRRPCSVSSSH